MEGREALISKYKCLLVLAKTMCCEGVSLEVDLSSFEGFYVFRRRKCTVCREEDEV